MDYNQLLSGGSLNFDISIDTNLENTNNETWIRDASIITNYSKNINKNYNINIESAFQSSPTYLRRTNQNNIINRDNTLSSKLNLNGYNLKNEKDILNVNISGYQVVKNNEDNKTTPTTLPYISYTQGPQEYNKIDYQKKSLIVASVTIDYLRQVKHLTKPKSSASLNRI